MLLSDKHLKELAYKHELITPFNEKNCEGATINLTLDSQIKKHISNEKHTISNEIPNEHYETINITEKEFYLGINESVLVQSYEYFKVPTNMSALILERYSFKLKGLVVSPASYMNPGYEGRMSFLLTNHSNVPMQLVAGVKFSQLAIAELSSEADTPYIMQDAKYMGSRDVHISKLHLDSDIQEYMRENNLGEISGLDAQMLGKHLIKKIEDNAKLYAKMIKEKLGELDEPTA